MDHRHLVHRGFTAAAIDDIIERGGRSDWVELRNAVVSNPSLVPTILRVCAARQNDPYAQRHHLWRHYAGRHAA
ncbi:MAG: hypothetical protein FJ225_05320 [Lentisphaerae bacterium]|nr:hypothetical protein [Lentisphaerota bacterium]